MSAFSLSSATGTIDLPASRAVIEVSALPLIAIANYRNLVTLVNQNGDTLVNQNGDTLVAYVIQSIRTNIVDLGA